MRAIVYEKFGGPDVLHATDLTPPKLQSGQVLVDVHAAGVNPIDWRLRNGSLRYVIPAKLPLVPGYDISGTIAEVAGETEFSPGDAVFGMLDSWLGGAYAERAAVTANVLARKPENLSHVQAAAVPLAACTALQALQGEGELREGEAVLINGASGGVGTFAVQIAKLLGAHVTGVCSAKNLKFVRELGADEAIDYKATDFTRGKARYDIVFDAVAHSSYGKARRVLKAGGRYITTVPSVKHFLWRPLATLTRRSCQNIMAKTSGSDMEQLANWIRAEQLKPIIAREFPLAAAADAHRESEAGHVRGKLVLRVRE